MSRTRIALVVLFCAALLLPMRAAQASYSVLCSGYGSCSDKGYSSSGYSSHQGTSYWRMYTGTNCTNYVAYRLVSTNGMPNVRPRSGVGNAQDWGTAMASITDRTPAVGSVAWWGKTGHHVAYVEKVVSSTEILVSESNWSGAFDWRRITKSGSGWPDGFIHFADLKIQNTARPTVPGTPKVGTALTAYGGRWSPSGNTYRYQWYASGRAISGATSKTFTPAAAQVDLPITLKVTASRSHYPSASAVSAPAIVRPGALRPGTAPAVAGTARVDEPLTASSGSWTPTPSVAYQWTADGAPVGRATTATFTPGPDLLGRRIAVTVRASRPGYVTTTSTSAPTAALAPGRVVATVAPSVSGTPKVGVPLDAHSGTWSKPDLDFDYQWLADGTPVAGATTPTYVPTAAELGRTMTVRVTATRAGYTTSVAVSAATPEVAAGTIASTSRPAVSGTPRVGARLTASNGGWAPSADYTVQWYADGRPISGATGRAFVPTSHQRGAQLGVKVVARRAGYVAAAATSTRTVAVATGRIDISAAPSVGGTPRLESVLTVKTGTHQPAAATLRYQWLRDGKAIAGSTRQSRRVSVADLGHRLSARVTMSSSGYATRAVTTPSTSTAKATSRFKLAMEPGTRRITFAIALTAGEVTPSGKVTVHRVGGGYVTVKLSHGKARLTLTNQPTGANRYTFSYPGTSTVTSATAGTRATIR